MIRAAVLALLVGLAVVACGPAAGSSPTASSATSANPTATDVAAVTAAPTVTPLPPSPTPGASPVASVACAVMPQTGLLPSDRLTDVAVVHDSGRDSVRFSFGESSLEPVGTATGTLAVAVPPFTEASSGAPIDVHGQHALRLVFKGMSLQNDAAEPTYTGQRDIEAVGGSVIIRHAVIFDESEGQIGWFVGYDGSACPTLTRDGSDIVLALGAGAGN